MTSPRALPRAEIHRKQWQFLLPHYTSCLENQQAGQGRDGIESVEIVLHLQPGFKSVELRSDCNSAVTMNPVIASGLLRFEAAHEP